MTTKEIEEYNEVRSHDAWIAEHLFGCKPRKIQVGARFEYECACYLKPHADGGSDGLDDSIPSYHSDKAAAFDVLEKCARKLENDNGDTAVEIVFDSGEYIVSHSDTILSVAAETLPLAICLFAQQLFQK